MLVALKPEEHEQISIRVRIYPDSKEKFSPENIKLAILSDSGATLKEVTYKKRQTSNLVEVDIENLE